MSQAPPRASLTQSSLQSAHQSDVLKQILASLAQIEEGTSSFFARINNTFEEPYAPAEATGDYDKLMSQLSTIQSQITSLGLNELVLPEGQSLDEVLKSCNAASANAYKSAMLTQSRATIAQKSLVSTSTYVASLLAIWCQSLGKASSEWRTQIILEAYRSLSACSQPPYGVISPLKASAHSIDGTLNCASTIAIVDHRNSYKELIARLQHFPQTAYS